MLLSSSFSLWISWGQALVIKTTWIFFQGLAKGVLKMPSFPLLLGGCSVPSKAAGSHRDGKVQIRARQKEKKKFKEICISQKPVLKEDSKLG